MHASDASAIRRVRPLLGTDVTITVSGIDADVAQAAITRGFAAIAAIHRLMSFHEPDSDLSRLNRLAATRSVQVHADTFVVLTQAQAISARTDGVFDVTIAPQLVAIGFLPRPGSQPSPRGRLSWRDIALESNRRVRFRRRLWIDLGGIAKGFAVDRALAAMALPAAAQIVINAGGDLRVAGPHAERVLLRAPLRDGLAGVIELEGGSLASSSGHEVARTVAGRRIGPHIDGRTGKPVATSSFVSVLAQDCMVADALTKVVLALGRKSAPVLRDFAATAHLYRARGGWCSFGAGV